jgi:hypothetical protein
LNFLFSQAHIERVKEILTSLTNTKSDESHFSGIENLFFEVISIVRIYGNDVDENKFLAQLKKLETNEYKVVQDRTLTKKNRETMIRKLKNSIKQILQKWLKQPNVV